MRSVLRKEKSKKGNNPDSFSHKKPHPGGLLDCDEHSFLPVRLSDKRLAEELKRLGWNDEFRKAVLNIRRRVFDGGKVTSAESGQIEGVNLSKESDGFKVSMYINRWHMLLHVDSVSDKKRCKVIDDIKNLVEKNLPDAGIAIVSEKTEKITKRKHKYMVQMKAALNKPDELCEGKKNVCKVQSPPEIHIPSTESQEPKISIRGC